MSTIIKVFIAMFNIKLFLVEARKLAVTNDKYVDTM
jgi:hypothetical protein